MTQQKDQVKDDSIGDGSAYFIMFIILTAIYIGLALLTDREGFWFWSYTIVYGLLLNTMFSAYGEWSVVSSQKKMLPNIINKNNPRT